MSWPSRACALTRRNRIVSGHEIVGVIDAVGAGVTAWHAGDRVGVGYLGGQDNECEFCRRGDFVNCTNQPWTGTTVDGGYTEYTFARASGLVRIPEGLNALETAPLLCAGLTTYSALQQIQAHPGALVGQFHRKRGQPRLQPCSRHPPHHRGVATV